MPHPYVEQDSTWDFRSIYYDQPYPPSLNDRADVDDKRIRFAPVILRMTLAGGDPDEMRKASLFYVAHCVTREMMLSSAGSRLNALAEDEGRELDSDLASRLKEEAELTLSGIALVGCLRAIGWALSQVHPTKRIPLALAARSAHAACGASAGLASLAADDAHAHLSMAERMRPPEGEPRRSEVIDLRERLTEVGFLLLCAAVARAYEEPWNPFVQERLRRELAEHESAQAWLSGTRRHLHSLGEHLLQAVRAKHDSRRVRYEEGLSRNTYDIDAFFLARWGEDRITEADEALQGTMRQLLDHEPQLRQIV